MAIKSNTMTYTTSERDQFAIGFIKWTAYERWYYHRDSDTWRHDYKTYAGYPVFCTTQQLLTEYINTLKDETGSSLRIAG